MDKRQIIILILYVICIFIYVQTYLYLVQIDECPCFHKDGKYEVNIDFMKFFQVLEIFILTVLVFSTFFFKSNFFKSKNRQPPFFLLSLVLVFLLSISGFMTYNVINMYTKIQYDCKCTDSWYRYFLYYEGFVSGITVFRFIVMALVLSIFYIFRQFK